MSVSTEQLYYLAHLLWQHAALSWPPVLVSALVAVPLGWLGARNAWLRKVVAASSGVLYAIPSLALFVVLPLIVGTSVLSPYNVMIALSLYGVALMLRTAVDAFAGLERQPVEAAIAVGYPLWKRVLMVELPLAGPVLLAGLRVVSASTISLVSVGALIGVTSLGTLFTDGFARDYLAEIIVGVVLTAVLAAVFDAVLIAVGKVCLPWA